MKKIVLFIVSLVLAVSALGATEEPVNVSIESYKIWDSQTATVTYEPLEEVFPETRYCTY